MYRDKNRKRLLIRLRYTDRDFWSGGIRIKDIYYVRDLVSWIAA